MKSLLNISVIVSIFTYLFWTYLPKGSFYIGNALFVLLICLYLYLNDKKSNVKFLLFSLSFNNFLDEVLFDNTKFQLNEILFFIVLILIILYRIYNGRYKKPII
jgi:predicted neutral ceramidase superfamily lipid hydrolase